MASVTGYHGRSTVGTIRSRSVLAGVALLIVFGGMAVLAIWRTGSDRGEHAALERRSGAVAALQEARAQLYLSGTLLALAVLSEDPVPLVNSYGNAVSQGQAYLQDAETALLAESDPQALAALQGLNDQLDQLRPTLDALITVGLTSDKDTVQRLAAEYLPQVWPAASQILIDLGQLARVEQAKLTEAGAEANKEADTSLWLMVMTGIAGFLVAVAVLANLIRSVVRPLASLQRSVRAVASGDMESRAKVSGPQEVASLATDFNAMIVQLNGATEQMRHRLDVESAVARTSALLDNAQDIDAGLNTVLKTLAEAVDAEHAYIFMFKDGNTRMDNTHEWNAVGKSPPRDRFVGVDCATYGWWVGRLMRNEEVVLHDLSQLPAEATAERALLEGIGAKCALAVPFGASGKPDGFIGFGDTRVSHIWHDEDIKLLRLASESVSSFINRRRAEQALRESEERFRSLSASAPVGILLTSADDVLTYTNECLRAIVGLDPNDRLEDVSRDYVLANFVHPDDRQGIMKAHIEASARGTYEFFREFRIIMQQGETRWVRVHVIPILSGEGAQTGRVGTVEDITEHKMLEEERQNAYERTTLLLAMAAEARDPYTEHHLFRIRGYSEAIALHMGLAPDVAKEIGLASLLHDIGKTRVPDAILTKPGPLTEAEWQVMRRHTIWGEELLPASALFTTARQIARSHHENWDGSGYPDGLKREQIPLSATIVAVADGFDAMTSKRPYKGAWPSARAMRELRSDNRHRYSPQVVEAFERAVAEGTIAHIAGVRRSKLSDLMKAA